MKKILSKVLISLITTISVATSSYAATFNIDYDKNTSLSKNINIVSSESLKELKQWFNINNFDKKITISILNDNEFNKIINNSKVTIDGFAVSEQDLVVLKESSVIGKTNQDIKRLLKHEISHLFLASNFKDINLNYEKFPRWFNEGLSQFLSDGGSEIYSYTYQNSLQSAFITGSIIPFSNLIYYFPSDRENFSLAYAQSISFVEFLVKKYGEDKLKELFKELPNNKNFFISFEKVYQDNFFIVENLWKNENRSTQYTLDYYFATHINSIINAFMVFLFLIAFLIAVVKNKKRKKLMYEMEHLQQKSQ